MKIDIKEQDKIISNYHPNQLGPCCFYDGDHLIRTYDPSHGNVYYKYEVVNCDGKDFEIRRYIDRKEYIELYC